MKMTVMFVSYYLRRLFKVEKMVLNVVIVLAIKAIVPYYKNYLPVMVQARL